MTADAINGRMVRERVRLERQRLSDLRLLLSEEIVVERLGLTVAATLIQLIDQQDAAYANLDGGESGPGWVQLRERTRTGDRVLGECLAVVAGGFSRAIPLLDEACQEAYLLAREIYRLTQISPDSHIIPADSECVNAASSVVRRRFPDYGVWDLPVVAHEFGHLVARDLLDTDPLTGDTNRPIADFLAGRRRQTAELASDVFAVYVIGAAYVLALVLHRMDPMARAVTDEEATHPGDPSRVVSVIRCLELLGDVDVAIRRTQYSFLVKTLSEWWGEAQATAPAAAHLDKNAVARVQADTERVWRRLASSKLSGARYRSFAEARAMADGFRNGRTPEVEAASCRDILNAAWLVRFRSWRDDVELPRTVVPWVRDQLGMVTSIG